MYTIKYYRGFFHLYEVGYSKRLFNNKHELAEWLDTRGMCDAQVIPANNLADFSKETL